MEVSVPYRNGYAEMERTDENGTGGYAEYICVSTHMLIHKPKELSFEECAGIPEVS